MPINGTKPMLIISQSMPIIGKIVLFTDIAIKYIYIISKYIFYTIKIIFYSDILPI